MVEVLLCCCYVSLFFSLLFRMLLMLLRDVRHPPHAMTREAFCNWARLSCEGAASRTNLNSL